MNQVDRDRAARLYEALGKLPWPNRGRTIGPRDLSDWFRHSEDFIPLVRRAIMYIARPDADAEEPEETLEELEELLRTMSRDTHDHAGGE